MNTVAGHADEWAVRAAALPLAFAQVREDPRLDLELARKLPPGGTVVMIASGGDTAACLARLPLRLHLVDVNPAQIALSRLKWRLAADGDPARAAALLGHLAMAPELRRVALQPWFEGLGLDEAVFGPPERVAASGPDHCGRYELAFAELRDCLSPWRAEIQAMLVSPLALPQWQDSPAAAALDAAFAGVMSLANLVCLFGQEATQNPRRPFAEHFAARTRGVIARLPPASNPFLWQILAGRFPENHRYDWLQPRTAPRVPPPAEAIWHVGGMDSFLDSLPDRSVDLLHFSNILDWLPEDAAGELLRAAARVLKPAGTLILRQLNSTLDLPGTDSGLAWDPAAGRAMEAADRSYFYPEILIGRPA